MWIGYSLGWKFSEIYFHNCGIMSTWNWIIKYLNKQILVLLDIREKYGTHPSSICEQKHGIRHKEFFFSVFWWDYATDIKISVDHTKFFNYFYHLVFLAEIFIFKNGKLGFKTFKHKSWPVFKLSKWKLDLFSVMLPWAGMENNKYSHKNDWVHFSASNCRKTIKGSAFFISYIVLGGNIPVKIRHMSKNSVALIFKVARGLLPVRHFFSMFR